MQKKHFMYMQMHEDLCVLDISKLLAWSSLDKSQRPRRPEFKLVHGSCFPDGRSLPTKMAYMIVDSKSYIVGGCYPLQPPNLEAFACKPNPDDPDGLCKSNLPTLSGPKLDPFVFTSRTKFMCWPQSVEKFSNKHL
ncbi:uncharacterized protein Pyn_04199 [Prunus yedoensis var. nudiflora]|uniref:Uncharacterized protein n=1 Tax=Prunus yedoensis var. nudiflora TaxID=2094558 RepID=A0A314YBD4_PRUYE|nr:uncharacterized protein Pyn_04199 [Prunus yedoensis var. nudiflora]